MMQMETIHRVSKNVPPLASYNFDIHEWILIFLGRNVTDKRQSKDALVCHLKKLGLLHYMAKRGNMKITLSLNWIVTHTMHLCAVFLKEKKLSSVM